MLNFFNGFSGTASSSFSSSFFSHFLGVSGSGIFERIALSTVSSNSLTYL